jgi:hypothetical protein
MGNTLYAFTEANQLLDLGLTAYGGDVADR